MDRRNFLAATVSVGLGSAMTSRCEVQRLPFLKFGICADISRT